MSVTDRDAAIEMADNLRAELAQPIIAEIERQIKSSWLGPPTSVAFYKAGIHKNVKPMVWKLIKQLYEDAGWDVTDGESYFTLR